MNARVMGNREMVSEGFKPLNQASFARVSVRLGESATWGVIFITNWDWVPHGFMAYPMQKATQSELDSSLEDSIP